MQTPEPQSNTEINTQRLLNVPNSPSTVHCRNSMYYLWYYTGERLQTERVSCSVQKNPNLEHLLLQYLVFLKQYEKNKIQQVNLVIYFFYLFFFFFTHTSLGTRTDYSIICISKVFCTAGVEGSQTVREKHNKAHTEIKQGFKWAAQFCCLPTPLTQHHN